MRKCELPKRAPVRDEHGYAGGVPARRFSTKRPLSRFGTYLVQLCHQRRITVTHVAEVLGGKSRMSYALRGRTGEHGRGVLLSYDELDALARRLRCTPSERQKLILLGLLEHAPVELQSAMVGLIRQQSAYTDLDFSGTAIELPDDY